MQTSTEWFLLLHALQKNTLFNSWHHLISLAVSETNTITLIGFEWCFSHQKVAKPKHVAQTHHLTYVLCQGNGTSHIGIPSHHTGSFNWHCYKLTDQDDNPILCWNSDRYWPKMPVATWLFAHGTLGLNATNLGSLDYRQTLFILQR